MSRGAYERRVGQVRTGGVGRTWAGVLGAALWLLAGAATLAQSPKFHVGRTPSDEDTRALGIMVAPDGTGLPAGSGTAVEGKEVFTARCASCHGAKGEGGDGPALVGGKGTLATPTPKRTVGSYWPYATTVWDYVNRAMPFNQPGTLTSTTRCTPWRPTSCFSTTSSARSRC